jgi:hypothetical protein
MELLVLPRVEFWEKAGYSSDGRKHAFAEQRKASLPIALPFDQFELGHMPFYHAIIDRAC